MNTGYVLMSIAAMGVVTFGLRALPFLTARWLRDSPRVMRLGGFLPSAIMVILLMHSIRDLGQRSSSAYLAAELICVAVVLLLQWYKSQPLLSILAGTGLYMGWLELIAA